MMPRCLANGCRNGCETPEPSVSFHAFPVSVDAARCWAGLCGVHDDELARLAEDVAQGDSAKYQLCSLHFEEIDFEESPASTDGEEAPRGEERKLRHGAVPSLHLAAPSRPGEDRAEHGDPVPDPGSAAEAQDTELPHTSYGAHRADVPTCTEISSPDPEPPPTSPSVSGQSCACTSHCVTQSVLRSAHQNVNQVILDFLEKNEKPPGDNVSFQCAARSPGSCHSTQHTVRQIVLIFMDSPNLSSLQTPPTASQEAPCSTAVSTQTEITGWPGGPPHHAAHTPPPLCREPPRTVHCSTQTELSGETLPSHLRNPHEESRSPPVLPRSPLPCESRCGSCALTPSLNQYVDRLLAQHRVSSCESVTSSSASTSPCSCRQSQPLVKQIILNFLEPQSDPEKQYAPSSSPAGPRHRHADTQTDDGYIQQNLKEPTDRPASPSPPASPAPCATTPPSLIQVDVGKTGLKCRESPADPGPRPRGETQKDAVTFEEVAVYFSEDEWQLLGVKEKALYREVMMENYQAVCSLGYAQGKPGLILRIEQDQPDLWVEGARHRRSSSTCREDGHWCLLDVNLEGIHLLDGRGSQKPLGAADGGAPRGGSHLGALMRLVNEIPGFLLGSAVTDGSASPAWSAEDHENLGSVFEIKTEECSPASTPLPACIQRASGMPDTDTNSASMEPGHSKAAIKAEESKAEVAIDVVSRLEAPFSPQGSPFSNAMRPPCEPPAKRECRDVERSIKQEESCSLGAARGHPGPGLAGLDPFTPRAPPSSYSPCSPGDRMVGSRIRRNSCKGRISPWLPAPKPGYAGGSCGNVRIKHEDGEGDDLAAGRHAGMRTLCERPANHPHQVKDRQRSVASPGRSPVDNLSPGNAHLHGLVNCLKEISLCRPRPPFTLARWGSELGRRCSEAAVRSSSLAGRASDSPLRPPNPFTVAVTNGVSWMSYSDRRTPESSSPHSGRDGKCPEKATACAPGPHSSSRSRPQRSEETLRPNLGVKREHSEDLPLAPGAIHSTKRPALDTFSPSHPLSSISPGHRDPKQPPEEIPRGPGDGSTAGTSHLGSVVDCVKKSMLCRESPPTASQCTMTKTPLPARGPGTRETDNSWSCTQSVDVNRKSREFKLQVKEEKSPSPAMPVPGLWVQPHCSPRETEGQGSSSRNVHLNGLMRLMEELPRSDAGSLSRAMYSIAVGRSEIRRTERTNHLPYPNDDGIFQPESSDTIASMDSIFSDDTSLSSEHVDPSYSAIGGLQKVVSEFAELGSVSPLVAVAAPPVTGSVQEESGHHRGKDRHADSSRIHEQGRGAVRDVLGSEGSRCSTEDGKASYAALCGLEKVVHGFSEQNCVSPFSAVRIPSGSNLPEITTNKHPDLDDAESSYSALSGLQKVVNGFSEMECVSPFSAISTTASEGAAEASARRRSEQPTLDTPCGHNAAEHFPKSSLCFLTDEDWPVSRHDSSYSALSGLQKVVNGVPDMACLSPLTVVSIPSSDGDQDPGVRRQEVWRMSPRPVMERQGETGSTIPAKPSTSPKSPRKTSAPCNQYIDLTKDEEETNCTRSSAGTPHKPTPRGTNAAPTTPDKQQTPTPSLRSTNISSPSTLDKQQKPILNLRSTNTSSPSTLDKQQKPILNLRSTNTSSPSTLDKQQKPILSLRSTNTSSPSTMDKQQKLNLSLRSRDLTPPALDKHQGPNSRGTTPTNPDQQQNPIPRGSNSTCSMSDRQQKLVSREGSHLPIITASRHSMITESRPLMIQASSSQCIDLTMEEPPPKPKDHSSETRGAASSHSANTRKPRHNEKRHRPYIDLTRDSRRNVDKPLDPGLTGQEKIPGRDGVPVINEHLSGLEKLLKDMPSFPSTKNTGGYGQNATWWFKSTSPHET